MLFRSCTVWRRDGYNRRTMGSTKVQNSLTIPKKTAPAESVDQKASSVAGRGGLVHGVPRYHHPQYCGPRRFRGSARLTAGHEVRSRQLHPEPSGVHSDQRSLFVPDRASVSAPQMTQGVHHALVSLGILTIVSTAVFRSLEAGDGSNVSREKVIQAI